MKGFAQMFSSKVALPTFTAIIELLKGRKEGVYLSPRVAQLCYVYLSYALKLQSLRRTMQLNLHFLVEHAILPVLCLDCGGRVAVQQRPARVHSPVAGSDGGVQRPARLRMQLPHRPRAGRRQAAVQRGAAVRPHRHRPHLPTTEGAPHR